MSSRRPLRSLLLVTGMTCAVLLPTPAQAVIPVWTARIPFVEGGNLVGTVSLDGDRFVLLQGYDTGPVCRLARLDATGQVVWIRAVASRASCVAIDGDETGLYVAINVGTRFEGTPTAGGWDVVVRKLDFEAGTVWTRWFSTPDSEVGGSIAATGHGVILGGFTWEEHVYAEDGYVRRYDGDGQLRWTRFIRTDQDESVDTIAVDDSGIYVGIGYHSDVETTVRRFALDGSPGWTWSLGTIDGITWDLALDGDRLIAGGILNVDAPDTRSAFLASIDTRTGARAWMHTFGGTDAGAWVTGVAAGPAGVYVTGFTWGSFRRFESRGSDDAFVRSYDVDGHRRWTRQFGTRLRDRAYAVDADAGGVVTTGTTDGSLGGTEASPGATFVRRWERA